VRRFERREARQLRRWLERTSNLLHVSVLVFVPLLVAVVTVLSNEVSAVSFLLFPPLASGTYTLFADPEGRYASPTQFVAGMTTGALAGWVALEVSATYLYGVPEAEASVHAGAAALAIFLTGVVTWALDVEEPTAFSTSLLVLITGTSQLEYVVGVMLSSALVAVVFAAWRDEFYEERARYLYSTTGADDHVLVPMRGDAAAETAMFGARIAAAHDAGKVVLLDVVEETEVASAEADAVAAEGLPADEERKTLHRDAEARVADDAADALEAQAHRVETEVGVPCEVVVAADGADVAATAVETAEETNCGLVVTPFETADGGLSPFVRGLFRSDLDVVAFRSVSGRTRWRRVMVPVRRPGDVAHAMIDYAERLAGATGLVSVCTCIQREDQRRPAESMLADLAETVSGRVETRVSRSSIERFLERNDAHYDVVFLGASTNRSAASRFLSPPTFERVGGVETDVAVVHTG
jgi:hypothetical protein